MFANLTLRQRILLGCTVPLAILLGCLALIHYHVQQAARFAEQLENYRAQEEGAYLVNIAVLDLQRAARGYLLFKDSASRKSFDESTALLQRQEGLLRKVADPQQLDLLRRLLESGTQFRLRNQGVFDLMDAGRSAEAERLFREDTDLKKAREETVLLAGRLLKGAQELREQHQARFNASIDAVGRTMTYGTIISAILAFATIWSIATALSRKISGYAAHLASAAAEIAAAITEQERTASQQAAAANQTSVTIEELSNSSRQSADQAANVASLAGEASRNTEEGSATAGNTMVAMVDLKDKINRMSEHIVHLNDQIGQIGTIATLVRDLAGEINMLALNAAVEASRAGEHGKGFAVVAGEVRKLADQSKRSAEQAAGIIADILKSTGSSIMMTEDSSRMVAEVTGQAEQVRALFTRLADMVETVSMSASQVMLNAQQQATAFNQVVEATTSISAGSRETATGISQTKDAVERLNQTAQSLKAMA